MDDEAEKVPEPTKTQALIEKINKAISGLEGKLDPVLMSIPTEKKADQSEGTKLGNDLRDIYSRILELSDRVSI